VFKACASISFRRKAFVRGRPVRVIRFETKNKPVILVFFPVVQKRKRQLIERTGLMRTPFGQKHQAIDLSRGCEE